VRRPQVRRDRIWFRRTAAKLLRAPFTRETGRQIEYAVLGLLLAIPGFVFIVVGVTVGFGMSLSFAGMLVGLPLLMVTLLGARRLGAVHCHLAGRLLGAGRAAAAAACAAWRLRPDPGGPGRSGRLADLCLPAAQAAALGA